MYQTPLPPALLQPRKVALATQDVYSVYDKTRPHNRPFGLRDCCSRCTNSESLSEAGLRQKNDVLGRLHLTFRRVVHFMPAYYGYRRKGVIPLVVIVLPRFRLPTGLTTERSRVSLRGPPWPVLGLQL